MIYTVTLNPSIDYIVDVPNFRMHFTNRTASEIMVAGGKGINVSELLKNLGKKSTALGFSAGFTGNEIQRQLSAKGIGSKFVEVKNGHSRINVKLRDFDGTEINGEGPVVNEDELKKFMHIINEIKRGDVLVLAGSIPKSLDSTIYMKILSELNDVMVIVDATSSLLLNTLKYAPFLIKPNKHELEEIFGIEINLEEEFIFYAKELQKKGAINVLISRGKDGAILVDEYGKIHKCSAPDGKLISAVGAGDSMVAGFISGYLDRKDYEHAFKMSVASGSASAFSEGLATEDEIMKLYNMI